jgi:hypothetical protein
MVLSVMPTAESIRPLGPNGNLAPQPPPPTKAAKVLVSSFDRGRIHFFKNEFL